MYGQFSLDKIADLSSGICCMGQKVGYSLAFALSKFQREKVPWTALDVISGSRRTPISINHGGSGRRTRKNNVNLCREANKGGLNYDV